MLECVLCWSVCLLMFSSFPLDGCFVKACNFFFQFMNASCLGMCMCSCCLYSCILLVSVLCSNNHLLYLLCVHIFSPFSTRILSILIVFMSDGSVLLNECVLLVVSWAYGLFILARNESPSLFLDMGG